MNENRTLPLTVAALGVVYGDIGTSPIYALRECFFGTHRVAPSLDNVLGILSLMLWSLVVVISVKYLLFVMRADNKGEGGIVALVALLNPWRAKTGSLRYVLMLLGLFGGALLYGDGTITPAISVLSAIEGLQVATPAFERYVIPITVAILAGLFMLQKRGTGGVGAIFGPVILVWFATLAALGIRGIASAPEVLRAVNPIYAVTFFLHNGASGFMVLGAVFLVVTGGEALYADMGHFGRRPIRLAWFSLVLPALLLNYFGQGALLLRAPGTVQPFYALAPAWAIYPLVGITTAATIIASQAVISATFSLTRQLVQLSQLPRMNVIHTSGEEEGQIYVPFMNVALMLATIALVLGFKSSSALASAYGIAVSLTMVITTVLAFFVARRFGWNLWLVGALGVLFLTVDMTFFAANAFKFADGGWYPLAVAALMFTLMTTWSHGRQLLDRHLSKDAEPLDEFVKHLKDERPHRIPGTAVFMTSTDEAPPRLMRHLQQHHVLHKHVVLLTVVTEDEPRVEPDRRLEWRAVGQGISRVTVRYGFMQNPNVPAALRLCEKRGLTLDLDNVTYYIGRETLIPTSKVPGMMLWREHLFAFLVRNAMRVTAFYRLPPEQVVELGFQVEI